MRMHGSRYRAMNASVQPRSANLNLAGRDNHKQNAHRPEKEDDDVVLRPSEAE